MPVQREKGPSTDVLHHTAETRNECRNNGSGQRSFRFSIEPNLLQRTLSVGGPADGSTLTVQLRDYLPPAVGLIHKTDAARMQGRRAMCRKIQATSEEPPAPG